MEPIICFGQQPCGFFPKRYLVAKIRTARALQQEIGGKIVFFYHDSDHDYRETITVMRDRQSGEEARLNFLQENKIQKKYSPLYAKRIPAGWQEEMQRQLPRFMDESLQEVFASVQADIAADFCLEMYRALGLLKGIEVVRSGAADFREPAADLTDDFFADVSYEGEIVRARCNEGKLSLHRGGGEYIFLPEQEILKTQKNPARDQRFGWMQSVLNCTHYIAGKSEMEYLNKEAFPEVQFIEREEIEREGEAFLEFYSS